MRLFLTYTAVILGTFAVMMVAVRVVGGMNRRPAIRVVDAGECGQPCWNGIQPGRTTLDHAQDAIQANDLLAANPGRAQFDNERCWDTPEMSAIPAWHVCTVFLYGSGRMVRLVRVNPAQGALALGDAIALFGDPLVSTLCWWDGKLPNMPSMFLRARIYFKDNIEVWAYSLRQPMTFVFDPQMLVYSVTYHPQAEQPAYTASAPSWHGFVRLRLGQWLGC